MQFFAFCIIITMSFLESWVQTWFSFSGVTLPLILSALLLLQAKINRQLLPWFGLSAGLIADLGSAGYFGVYTLYYLALSILLSLKFPTLNPKQRVIVRCGAVLVAALLQPFYLTIANRQFFFNLEELLGINVIRVAILGVIVMLLYMQAIRESSIEL